MSGGKSDQVVYAAAQGREFLRNALKGKENAHIYEYAGLIDDPETLDLLNYYCSLWADVGENFLETRLAEIVIRNAATRTTDRAYREGNVSQLQGMVGLTSRQEDGDDALARMARALTNEGFVALVVGSPGSGKTAMTLDIARIWKALTGGHVVTNIESWAGADGHVGSSDELKAAMGERSGKVLAVIDEGSQSLTSRGSEAKQSNAFAKDLKYVRKREDGDRHAKQGSVVVIGHTRKDTAADIRRVASAMWEKPSRKDPGRVNILESDGGKDSFEQVAEFKGITDTAESYNEHEASDFEVVVDDGGDGEDAPSPDDVRRREAIATVLRAVEPWNDDDGLGYRDAARLVDYSSSWVGDRVREFQDGQYRDLVDRPNGETA